MNTLERSLTLRFFPYKSICKVPLYELQASLISIFKTWGIPRWIKVDNGRPFGDPTLELVPPLSLWLIGLGIKVIWNTPRRPQQNAKVERCQGVLSRWTEFQKCQDSFELQIRLWQQARFYNYNFPIRKLGRKCRKKVFPSLEFTGQKWNPKNLKLHRILAFLSSGNWVRTASKVGQIMIYNHKFSIGMKYKHQQVSIRLCAKNNCWEVYDSCAQLIRSVPTRFSTQSIWRLNFS